MSEKDLPDNELPVENLVRHYGGDFDRSLKAMAKIGGYSSVPPTIEEFMDDKYYLKDVMDIYPTWRDYLIQIFPNPFYCQYAEIAVTGAIGTGKTFFCSTGALYDMAKLLCLKDPHSKFMLNRAKPIMLASINTTKSVAQATTFQNLMTWVNSSPYFIEQQARVLHIDKRRKRDLLPHRIGIMNASRGRDILGMDVFSAILSELNFQGEVVKDQAVQNYTQVMHRIESRFARGGGLMTPGRMWLDSSKSDETGWLEQHMKAISDDKDHNLIICEAIWEVLGRAGKHQYSDERFLVFVGDETRDPFILEGPGASFNIPEDLVIKVPTDYRRKFEDDLIGSIQNLAGYSTWGSQRFIRQDALINMALKDELNCVYKEVIELDFDEDYDQLINYVDLEKLDKSLHYFIHFDIGIKRDRTGIAMTACTGEVQVDRQNNLLQHLMTKDLIYKTPLVMAVCAKPGKEVPLSKLRNFIIHLIERGIMITGVSADGFQSTELIQMGKKAGLTANIVSVDRTRDPYDLFKDSILERRWTGPNHSILEKELKNLRDEGKKIDHPVADASSIALERPSKDVSDAVAGSMWHCKEYSADNKAGEAFLKYAQDSKKAMIQAKAINQMNQMQIQETSFISQLRANAKKAKRRF